MNNQKTHTAVILDYNDQEDTFLIQHSADGLLSDIEAIYIPLERDIESPYEMINLTVETTRELEQYLLEIL